MGISQFLWSNLITDILKKFGNFQFGKKQFNLKSLKRRLREISKKEYGVDMTRHASKPSTPEAIKEERKLVVDSPEFDRVFKQSVDIIKEIDRKKSIADTERLYDIQAKPALTRTQSDVDREIVQTFYENPTEGNFRHIWDRHHESLRRYAISVLGNEARADDIIQQVFIKAWECKDKFMSSKAKYTTWIYTMCKNMCIDLLRVDKRTHKLDVDVNDIFDNTLYTNMSENKELIDENYYIYNDETRQLEHKTYDDVVKKMFDTSVGEMSSLDPMFRTIITMKEIDNLTITQIATKLDLPESRVKNIYYKTRTVLAERIIANHNDLFLEYQSALADRSSNTAAAVFRHISDEDEDYETNYFVF